jgi:hypothetical protein
LRRDVVIKLPIPLSRKTTNVSTKDFSGNTDLSFDPKVDVKMSVVEAQLPDNQDEENIFEEIEEDEIDPDFKPTSDVSEDESISPKQIKYYHPRE